jgi:mono/diheme cytochrome c family protein
MDRTSVPTAWGLAAVGLALLVIALEGCAVKHPTANLVHGKQLFVNKCARCHTLAHAGTQGVAGPNLDVAFRRDRADGVKSTSIEGLVGYWIQYPSVGGVMPAGLVKGQAAQDVAAYVGAVAARPGQDSGALVTKRVAQKPAFEKAGTLQIDADPTGQLLFLAPSASATPGKVTLRMKNASSVPHDIGIKGAGLNQVGAVVSGGGTSTVSASLKSGTYIFYCSVDSHEASGMKGTLKVK